MTELVSCLLKQKIHQVKAETQTDGCKAALNRGCTNDIK